VEDGSNETDAFLRNRLRHHVMPLLRQENPCLAENVSQMAMSLRQDEEALRCMTGEELPDIAALRQMPDPLRSRALEYFLKKNGVKEPERRHIAMAESLVFSENPSARAEFPGAVTIIRCYEKLMRGGALRELISRRVNCPGITELPEIGLRLVCERAEETVDTPDAFTFATVGAVTVRPRCSGDAICLRGGTKTLKKLFIDKKIPVEERPRIPVLTDEQGILAVYGIGADRKRLAEKQPVWHFRFENILE
jgi:tRNA(Ile)-lysidine synthase